MKNLNVFSLRVKCFLPPSAVHSEEFTSNQRCTRQQFVNKKYCADSRRI